MSSARSGATRFGLPRWRRRRVVMPYRGYSYSRSRATPAVRDSPYRFPIISSPDPDLSWVKPESELKPKPKPEPEPEPEPEVVPDVSEVELATKLHVIGVDLHIDDNTKAHHSDMYECTEAREEDGKTKEAELVIRRGQDFKMTINFDRPYDIKKNDISLIFSLGDETEGAEKLTETFKLVESVVTSGNRRKWGASLVEKKDKSVTVSVFIPAWAPVGEWEFSVLTTVDVKDDKDIIWQYNHNQEIIVLFNPWCKEDLVYLKDETWLNEVVLNDSGVLYYGTFLYPDGREWYFGQFEDGILDASLHLLRKVFGYEATPAMGNVVRVVRALSKIVNSNDDAGVVAGNWADEIVGGTHPSVWAGSVKILKEYMSTAAPVKYGQCWVYSGVLTTVCRALGIPCRSVTNFESAHNSDNDHLSCDIVNIKMGDVWYEQKIDSVWNFHVWNEAWISRPDLANTEEGGPEYDGWQVIDATPQETSEGVFQCGPCPVKAIKEGQLNVGADTAFIFAEVNGDKVEWRKDPKIGMLIQLERKKSAIGKCIFTHEPTGKPYTGKSGLERLDITDQYKYPEGSTKERAIVRKAERMFRLANFEGEEGETPPAFEAIEMDIQDQSFNLGKGFDFKVAVKNTGGVPRTVNVFLEVKYKNYRGVDTGSAATKKIPGMHLKPGEKIDSKIEIDDYAAIKRPQDGFNFELFAIAEVKESETIVKKTNSIRLKKPKLTAKGPEKCNIEDTIEVNLTFTNPLTLPLTSCKFQMQGNLKPVEPFKDEIEIGEIKAGETWTTTLKMKPSKQPRFRKIRNVSFTLSSKQIGTVYGMYVVNLN